MIHPNEGTLQALLDGEVPGDDRAPLEQHVAACASCGAELDELRALHEEVGGALALLDVPAPTERARQQTGRAAMRRGPRATPAGTLGRAALLVLGSAAALAAMVPGSPVRGWIAEQWHGPAVVAEHAPAPIVASEPTPAGVSIRPTAGPVRVVLTDASPGACVRVRLYGGERLAVEATGAAARARFRTGADHITVDAAGPGELTVEVPRGVERFTLSVDGRTYLAKHGDQLRFPGPAAPDTAGPEIVFEVAP
jgi:hypothetical protein